MRHIYVASCVQGGGICHYKMHENGGLEYIGKTVCDNPMYMIINEKHMYILLREPFEDSSDSGLAAYEIDEHGELCNPSEIISTKGKCACHLCRFEGNIYGVNYLSGSVFNENGITRTHLGHGIRKDRQEMAHPHYISATPDGKYLMVADLGVDQIYIYDKALQLQSTAKLTEGAGPRHLIVLDEAHVACVNELECSVTILAYEEGKLMVESTVSATTLSTAQATSAAIRFVKPYCYVSTRGTNRITSFLVEHGHMNLLEEVSCQGESPRDFAIIGDFLYCANEASDTVTVFSVEKGRLTPLPDKTLNGVPRALCICFADL